MEVFSKGVVVTVTLFPLWTGSMTMIGWQLITLTSTHTETNQQKPVRISGIPRQNLQVLTLRMSSTTSVCTSPCTGSPLTWVMRSPAHRPASWAGPPSSTCCRLAKCLSAIEGRHETRRQLQIVCVYAPVISDCRIIETIIPLIWSLSFSIIACHNRMEAESVINPSK